MCFTVTATLRHTSVRRPGRTARDCHTAEAHYPGPSEAARRTSGTLLSPAGLGGQEVLRPRGRHRLERADPGWALRSVTRVVHAVRHAVVGPVGRGPAGHADRPRVLLDLRRRHLVRVPAHAAGAARHLWRGPGPA